MRLISANTDLFSCTGVAGLVHIMYTYSRAVSISVYPLDSKVLRTS